MAGVDDEPRDDQSFAARKRVKNIADAQAFDSVIAILDQSELELRDAIERGLANVAGLSHMNYFEAQRQTNRVMKHVATIRLQAFKKAFRLLRAQL